MFKSLHRRKNRNTLLYSDSNFSKAATGSKQHLNTSKQEPPKGNITQDKDSVVKVHSHFSHTKEKPILPIALVQIEHQGELFSLRALVDQGAQKTFISKKVQAQFALPLKNFQNQIIGMGGKVIENSTPLILVSIKSNVRLETQAIIISKLKSFLPSIPFRIQDFFKIDLLNLADPHFNKPAQIEMVIGEDILPFILKKGVCHNVAGNLLAQVTVFGWYISAPIAEEQISLFTTEVCEETPLSISQQLQKL